MSRATAIRAVVGLAGALGGVAAYQAMATTATGSGAFFLTLAAAAAAYAAIVFSLCVGARPSLPVVAVALGLACAARVPLLNAQIGDKSDVYRYLWDARVVRAGLNPYTVTPDAPALARLHTPDTRRMNNPSVPSPYPPTAQLLFALVTMVTDSPQGFRWALAACDVATWGVLLMWLRSTGRASAWLLAYAWHPLVIVEIAREGHLDVAGVLLVVGAAVAVARAAIVTATVLLVLAAAFKFLPVVLAPLLLARARLRHALLAVVLLVALYLPFVQGGVVPVGSVADMIRRFRFNSPLFDLLEQVASAWVLSGVAVAAGLLTAWLLQRRLGPTDPAAWAWPLAVTLLLSPMIYPWYLVWLLPFLATRATMPLAIWSLSVCATYVVWAGARDGAMWRVPNWALWIEYGAFALACVWAMGRRPAATAPASAAAPSSWAAHGHDRADVTDDAP